MAFAIAAGFFIGAFRGEIAKQKYIAKVKNRYEQHNKVQHDEVILDEFEFSAFHTS